jgi:hypothetical protein
METSPLRAALIPTRALAALLQRLEWFVCGLGGHQLIKQSEPRRLYLRCMLCAYETPG